jgi:predicted nucleic acid-binding protein
VWQGACEIAKAARKKGKSIPATDILIAACAAHHSVGLEYTDAHFDILSEFTDVSSRS